MTERRVRFTETARDHIGIERSWWLKNRDHQSLFATELEHAVQLLASAARRLRRLVGPHFNVARNPSRSIGSSSQAMHR